MDSSAATPQTLADRVPTPSSEPSDAALILDIRRGDTSKFEQIVLRYQPRIFGMVRRYVRNEAEAQDLAQDIFIKAFQKLQSFRSDAPFEHWLMRLAVRTCYDFLRQRQRNREHNATDLTDPDSDHNVLERSSAGSADPDRSNATRQFVHAALAQLSPSARMVITLLEIEERSIKEIAAMTGWSSTLIKVRAFRARAELKKVLAKLPVEKYL